MKIESWAVIGLATVGVTACFSSDDPVVGRVGDREVRASEFKAHLDNEKLPIRDREQLGRHLRTYLEREALAMSVREEGKLDEARVQAEVRKIERELLINRYFDVFLQTAVRRSAVEEYYNARASQWETKKVHVAHILVRTDKNSPPAVRDQKRKKIEAAQAELERGTEFGEVARKYSEDRVSANRGGDMGWLRALAVGPKFAQEVEALSTEGVSAPFESQFGYHIVMLLEAPRVEKRPLSAVEADIRYRLRAEAKKAEIERLTQKVGVEVNAHTLPASLVPDAKSARR